MASITPYSGGYRAQVSVRGKRASETFRTQREAKAWASATEARLREGTATGTRTVAEMLTEYSMKVSPKKAGARPEQLRLAAFIRDFPHLAALPLAEFQTPQLVAWRDARLEGFKHPITGKHVLSVSAAAVNRDINLLRNAFTVARDEWHWLGHNPFKGFKAPPEASPRTRRVDPWREVRPIVRWLGYRSGVAPQTKYQEVALAFLVALRSGMRAGEICALGRGTLDMQKRVATVHHKMEYLTGRPRGVPLTRHAARLLRPVADRAECFTVAPASLDVIFRRAKDKLGIKNLHFHDSRAEALTRLARKVDVMTLAKISGHKDLKLLLETYYRETPEQIAARL